MSNRIKVYISGPMSGIEDYNRPAFNRAAEKLTADGYEPINPARHPLGWEYKEYMRHALRDIADADKLAMLPGWQDSKGAQIERDIAQSIGIWCHELSHYTETDPS